jgi:hypothetical protein
VVLATQGTGPRYLGTAAPDPPGPMKFMAPLVRWIHSAIAVLLEWNFVTGHKLLGPVDPPNSRAAGTCNSSTRMVTRWCWLRRERVPGI